jgi:hypothetical protein
MKIIRITNPKVIEKIKALVAEKEEIRHRIRTGQKPYYVPREKTTVQNRLS